MSDLESSVQERGNARLPIIDVPSLLQMKPSELDGLFRTSLAGPVPSGIGTGTAIIGPIGPIRGAIHLISHALFWRGKLFDENRHDLMNLLSPLQLKAFRAEVYTEASLLDHQPCIVVDYAKTSRAARWIRDEIRQVAPSTYIGIVYVRGKKIPVRFALTFPSDLGSLESGSHRAQRFTLDERGIDWVPNAPVRVHRDVFIPAHPAAVFELLADHVQWPTWFSGMRHVRIDGPAAGIGALRTVWVGPSRVQERFLCWEPARRMSFAVASSNLPGLRAMVEDWQLDEVDTGTRLRITIGAEGRSILRRTPNLVNKVITRSTKGAANIVNAFA